jgi:methyltransferase
MVSVGLYFGMLLAIGLERLAELRIASRNARLSAQRGGVESGHTHYRVMVVLHALFLPACAVEVLALHRPFPGAVGWVALALSFGAQALRWSAIHALGERWNTRIIVVPGGAPVTSGPYRFVRHPNYLAVVLEMACVPLVHGAWLTAIVFSTANALLLTVRIRAEEAALGSGWSDAFAGKNRFVPGGPHA